MSMSSLARSVAYAAGRIPIVAGAGANAMSEAVALTEHAQKVGANAVLSVVPYYNKPTKMGCMPTFLLLRQAPITPVLLYNAGSHRC